MSNQHTLPTYLLGLKIKYVPMKNSIKIKKPKPTPKQCVHPRVYYCLKTGGARCRDCDTI